MRGAEELHRDLDAKAYRYMRPGLKTTDWGTLETTVLDPFGNVICFGERLENAPAA